MESTWVWCVLQEVWTSHCGPRFTFKNITELGISNSGAFSAAGPGMGPVMELIKRDPYVFSLLLNFLWTDTLWPCCAPGQFSLFVTLRFVWSLVRNHEFLFGSNSSHHPPPLPLIDLMQKQPVRVIPVKITRFPQQFCFLSYPECSTWGPRLNLQ